MERGNLAGVSPEVLDSVARALQLDDAETEHLHHLARAAASVAIRRRIRTIQAAIPPSLQRFLDAITGAPAWVRDQRADILATNPLGRALLAPMLDDPTNQNNIARFTFFSPAFQIFYPDWSKLRTTSWRPCAPPPGRTRTTSASPT
jgi:MmyB-like transcription regulator ligand binding domain